MSYLLNLRKFLLVVIAGLALTACATQKKSTGQMQSDVYTGTDTVEYLADGVPDRVFFATNESVLTTASRDTLRKQAAWLRKNSFHSRYLCLKKIEAKKRPTKLYLWVFYNFILILISFYSY